MLKTAQLTALDLMSSGGPTIGSLEHKILMDNRLETWQKHNLIQVIRDRTGNAPSSTPLTKVIGRLAGGTLGLLLARYFNMGLTGQLVGTGLGIGLGGPLANLYTALTDRTSDYRQLI